QKVDDLNAGFEDLGLAFELVECWWLAVDAPLLAIAAQTWLIQAVSQCVKYVALNNIANWHGDWCLGIGYCRTANRTIGRCHRNGTNQFVAEVLCNIKGNGACTRLEVTLDGQCIIQYRHSATRSLAALSASAPAPPTISVISWVICA